MASEITANQHSMKASKKASTKAVPSAFIAHTRIKPFLAAKAFFKLVRNKEDAIQAAVFRAALDGDWINSFYERFISDPEGVRLYERDEDLLSLISDEAHLASLPEGSLGRVYLDAIQRNGIDPTTFRGTTDGSQTYDTLPPGPRFAQYRRLDIHDLLHTVVGWGTDVLGEMCILEYQGVQYGSRGLRLLSFFGCFAIKQRFPDTKVFKCRREAREIAEAMKWVMTYDWEESLAKPLDQAREELGRIAPREYLSVYDLWQERDAKLKQEIAAKQSAGI